MFSSYFIYMFFLFLECGADEYTCQDKTCIPARAVCDRGCDCLGSCEDENGHGEYNCQCMLHPLDSLLYS